MYITSSLQMYNSEYIEIYYLEVSIKMTLRSFLFYFNINACQYISKTIEVIMKLHIKYVKSYFSGLKSTL